MRYKAVAKCYRNIFDFYHHVSKKYKHTYSAILMHQNIDEAIDGMYQIEQTLARQKPTIVRWQKQGYHMAHAGHWYYAYTIQDDTITIEDACHEQNMHN